MPDSTTRKADGLQLRVLYADDMRELRELMRFVLTAEGHSLETCENGQLALDRLRLNPAAYDLLITDHHMPVMNGLELVQQVRGLNFRGKILVFSSELSATVRDAYIALQVDRVMPKPIYPELLRQLLVDIFAPLPQSVRR